MRAAADLLDAERDEVAAHDDDRDGQDARGGPKAEVAKCATACRFYADHAEEFLADEPADAAAVEGAARRTSRYQPLGPVLAIMPWNFPLWQVDALRRAGADGRQRRPAQARVERAADRALPGRPVRAGPASRTAPSQTLLIGSDEVEARADATRGYGPRRSPAARRAGRSVAAIAGREIKKTVLELGGSDPFVVMPSADIAKAAEVAVTARCQNNGQSCIAAKRFIVHADVYDEFADGCSSTRMAAQTVGDPMDDGTDVGPLATEQGREDVDGAGRATRSSKGAKRAGAAARRPTGRLVVPADRRRRPHAGDADVVARRSSARSPGCTGSAPTTRRSSWPTTPTFGLGANAWTTRRRRAGAVRHRPRRRRGLRQRHGHVVPAAAVRRGARTPGTGGSCPRTASASSATSRPSGWGEPPKFAEKDLQREFWGC